MIRHHLELDRLWGGSYIGACILLAGGACGGSLPPLVPAGIAPADRDSALAFAAGTTPGRSVALTFKWKYRDERQSGGGRGMARLAAPDSLRVDWRAVLGLASGATVLIGDSVAWVDPPPKGGDSVPDEPHGVAVAWAALGVVRPPASNAQVLTLPPGGGAGKSADPGVIVWRFVSGPDTIDYRVTRGPPRILEAEWRRGGKDGKGEKPLVRIRTELDEHARPTSARIDSPRQSARFEFTVVAVDTTPVFPAPIWHSRH